MSISLEPQADIDPEPEPEPARKRRRWIKWVLLFVLIVLLALLGFGYWLATGLKNAAAEIKAPATEARTNLATMKTSLQAGDQAAAKTALAAAHRNIATADLAADRTEVKLAGRLPVLSSPVSDLHHLLTAAKDLVQGGDRVVALYDEVSGADSNLFRDSAFNLDAVRSSEGSVRELMGLLDKAEGELKQVRGGRFAEGAVEARDSALAQITQLRKDAEPLVKILGALPEAIGATTKKCYLVTLQNQAELRAGGGAPLSLTEVCFDKGAMTIAPATQTVNIDENAALSWTPVPGNQAWHPDGKALPFASANFAPDWPTSGEELLRAYEVMVKGARVDGVIGLDMTAMAAVLGASGGSISTAGYGTVTAETLPQTVLIDAYRKFDYATRHAHNAELMTQMVSRVISGGQLAGKIRALTGTSPGRHMLMYFRDGQLADLIEPTPMAGRLDPGAGDFAAMYTTNNNASKVDVYQKRTVTHDAVIQADGTAQVTRSMIITNNTPGFRGPGTRDTGFGYGTTFSRPAIAMYTPPGARIKEFTVVSPAPATAQRVGYLNDKKMRVLTGRANLPRKGSVTATVVYTTRAGAPFKDAYRLRIANQPTLSPTELKVTVQLPAGATAVPPPGWVLAGNRLTATITVSSDIDIVLPFTRS